MSSNLFKLIARAYDPTSPQQSTSMEELADLRTRRPIPVMKALLPVVLSKKSTHDRFIALIVCKSCIPPLTPDGSEKFSKIGLEPFWEVAAKLFTLFDDSESLISRQAASMVSTITSHFLFIEEGEDILNQIIGFFGEDHSSSFIECLTAVLCEIFQKFSFSPDFIMEALQYSYQTATNSQASYETRKGCVDLLRALVPNLADLLSENEAATFILSIIANLVTMPEIKGSAFLCLSELVDRYYPVLVFLPAEAYVDSLNVLESYSNPQDVIFVCAFWESVASCECDKHAELKLTSTNFERLFQLLFKVASSANDRNCSDDEAFEPFIAAFTALDAIIKCCGVNAKEFLMQNVLDALKSEKFGEREAGYQVFSSMIRSCSIPEFVVESFEAIGAGLVDQVPRVREAALNCVHAILLDILDNGDSSSLVSIIRQIGGPLLSLAPSVEALLEDEQLAKVAAFVAADYIRFPGFPYTLRMLEAIFGCIERAIEATDFVTVRNAFSSVSNICENLDQAQQNSVIEHVLYLLKEEDLIGIEWAVQILQSILIRMPSSCGFAGIIWDAVACSSYFEKLGSPVTFLCALARSNPEVFAPKAAVLARHIQRGLEAHHNSFALSGSASGLALIAGSPAMDLLLEELPNFMDEIDRAISDEEVDIFPLTFLLQAFTELLKYKAPQLEKWLNSSPDTFEAAIEKLTAFSSKMDESLEPDDEDYDDYEFLLTRFLDSSRRLLEIYPEEDSFVGKRIEESVVEVLEVVGGLQEHGPALIGEFIETLLTLVLHNPSEYAKIFEDEPSFFVLIREAQAGEIALEALTQLLSVFGS